jgi:hypothetical protein
VDEFGVVEYGAYPHSTIDDLYRDPTNKVIIQRTGARFEGVRIKKYDELSNPHRAIPIVPSF